MRDLFQSRKTGIVIQVTPLMVMLVVDVMASLAIQVAAQIIIGLRAVRRRMILIVDVYFGNNYGLTFRLQGREQVSLYIRLYSNQILPVNVMLPYQFLLIFHMQIHYCIIHPLRVFHNPIVRIHLRTIYLLLTISS